MAYEVNGTTVEADEEGYIIDIGSWNPELALLIAESENIEMGDAHALWASCRPRGIHDIGSVKRMAMTGRVIRILRIEHPGIRIKTDHPGPKVGDCFPYTRVGDHD